MSEEQFHVEVQSEAEFRESLQAKYPQIMAVWPGKERKMKVYQSINAVQRALSKTGISKDRTNTQGSGYKFRGIDDVYNAVAPLLAEYGLCILPRMLTRTCEDRQSKNGGALFYVTVEAEFDFVSAEDGSAHTVKTFGEAMDSGDKATNKAMSAAYKYACFQAFAIPTEGDNDADAQTHQVVAKSFKSSPLRDADGVLAIDSLPPDQQEYIRELAVVITNIVAQGKAEEAVKRIDLENLDNEQKMGLWSILDSKTRTAITKAKQPKKEAVAA